jgi:hypothetical protein
MPPVNVWPVEISAGTCNRRPQPPCTCLFSCGCQRLWEKWWVWGDWKAVQTSFLAGSRGTPTSPASVLWWSKAIRGNYGANWYGLWRDEVQEDGLAPSAPPRDFWPSHTILFVTGWAERSASEGGIRTISNFLRRGGPGLGTGSKVLLGTGAEVLLRICRSD